MQAISVELRELLLSNANNLVVTKRILEEYENKNIPSFFIIDILLEILQRRNSLSKEVELFLWEKIAELYEKMYEFKKALDIYRRLSLIFPNPKYLELAERIQTLQKFERLKYVFKKLNLSLEQIINLYRQSLETNKSVETIIIQTFKIPKAEILDAIQKYYQLPVIDLRDLSNFSKLPQVLDIKKQFFMETLCVPLKERNKNVIWFVCYDPENLELIEKTKKFLHLSSYDTNIAFGLKEDILELIEDYFDKPILAEMEILSEEPLEEVVEDAALIDSSIVQLVNSIIEEAYLKRASDIHWESLTGKAGLQV
ncbi:MAG: type II/IV secretion system protein, partial [Candidatus Aenigmatarchaeota archaeon]